MYLFCHAICDIPLEEKLVTQSNDLNWPVRVAQNISAPAAQVWELISTPGNLELFHPYCMRNPVTDWLGKSSKDEVHYYSGLIYEREFYAWIDGAGYDLLIGKRGQEKSMVSWRIKSINEFNCMISIEVRSAFLLRYARSFRWFVHAFWLRPRLRQYLSAVTQGIKWKVESGKNVHRNQFGLHPWFS